MRIALAAERYQPGQTVTGTLHLDTITGTCTRLLLRLWWVARGAQASTDIIEIVEEQTLAAGALAAGLTIPIELSLPLAPISHEGEVVAVRWNVTARLEWPDEREDTTAVTRIHLDPGPLPDAAALKAEWTAAWKKHQGLSWLDRALSVLKKRPLQLTHSTVSPGEEVEVSYSGTEAATSCRLVRIEEAARREVKEHPRTGKRTVYRWTVRAFKTVDGVLTPRDASGTITGRLTIPPDAAASLWRSTRRIRWEIRVSTTGQDVVVPLVVLPGS